MISFQCKYCFANITYYTVYGVQYMCIHITLYLYGPCDPLTCEVPRCPAPIVSPWGSGFTKYFRWNQIEIFDLWAKITSSDSQKLCNDIRVHFCGNVVLSHCWGNMGVQAGHNCLALTYIKRCTWACDFPFVYGIYISYGQIHMAMWERAVKYVI